MVRYASSPIITCASSYQNNSDSNVTNHLHAMKNPKTFKTFMNQPARLLIGLALAGLAAAASAQIRVENAWVRATVAGQDSTGAFMTITSTEPVKLLSISTTVAKTNEIHEMKLVGDVMKMRAHPDGVDIAANTTLELKSGGYHLMMMEMDQPIKAGAVVPLQLVFTNAKGQTQTLAVNAKASFKDPYKP